VVGSEAEIERESVECGKPLDIRGDEFFVGEFPGGWIVAQIHFQA